MNAKTTGVLEAAKKKKAAKWRPKQGVALTAEEGSGQDSDSGQSTADSGQRTADMGTGPGTGQVMT